MAALELKGDGDVDGTDTASAEKSGTPQRFRAAGSVRPSAILRNRARSCNTVGLCVALALGVLLALIAWPSAALAPVIAMLAKQLVEQAVTSLIKDTLLNSLNGLGCKGIALSNALNALDAARGGVGALPGMSMPAMPKLPDGMQMPTLPGGALPGMPGMPGMDATMIAGAEAKMRAMMPAGMALDPAQLALANPLPPPETVATIDELAEPGFLPAEFQTEMKECMVLVPASVPANDRKSFLASLDGGFFPPRVSEGVKARLGAK